MQLTRAMLPLVKRSLLLAGSFAILGVSSLATAGPPAPAALPPLPGGEAAAADPASPGAATSNDATPASKPAATPAPTAQQLYEHVRRGVVAVERNGVPTAIGTILDGDGRILTSLSGLGGADMADVRYADGTAVHAKVGHSDKEMDLALLIPQSGKWTDGLAASESDPVGAALRVMLPRGAHLTPAEAGVKGRIDAHARTGEPLASMLDVDVKGPAVAGAPLLDAAGSVVGVLVRACKGATTPAQGDSVAWAAWAAAQDAAAKAAANGCTPVVMGAPVSIIRAFLATTPATATQPAPWLGIRETVEQGTVRGVRVVAVAPASPAQKAGLKPNADVIAAADGRPIDSPEKLADTIAKHAPGETVKLLVFSDDKFRDVPIVLQPQAQAR